MSFFGDVLGFEGFNLKDMLSKAKSHPQQLLLGAGDPLSTKAWNGVLGTHYEPFVDQMGGAYGGHTISAFGKDDGGVYKRAQDAGINTGPGGSVHDLAHVVSAIYGAQGLGRLAQSGMQGLQGASAAQAITPSQAAALNLPESAATLPESAAPASSAGAGGFHWQDLLKMGGGGGGQQGQQPQAPAAPAVGMDPQKRQQLMQLGLGLLSRGVSRKQAFPWGSGIGSSGGLP